MDFTPPSSPFTPRLPHPPLPTPPTTTNTIGILSTHLLPSLTLHTTLSLAAYSAGRFTNRLDSKDLLWPSALVANAWYHGVVSPYVVGRAKGGVWECIRDMGYAQKLILAGVTVWGVRMFGKVFWRVKGRRGDDRRYQRYRDSVKKRRKERMDREKEKGEVLEEGDVEREVWNKAFLGIFVPEAVVGSLVSLGWSAVRYSTPINAVGALDGGWRRVLHGFAVGLFATALALEIMTDSKSNGQAQQQESVQPSNDGGSGIELFVSTTGESQGRQSQDEHYYDTIGEQ
ncbi:hypothetical protein AA313_de0209456 [Arthrobotrys entomopaga]|nr:hypothetical protein AA313_de0209456 [Arthrobotrys entomopaga]